MKCKKGSKKFKYLLFPKWVCRKSYIKCSYRNHSVHLDLTKIKQSFNMTSIIKIFLVNLNNLFLAIEYHRFVTMYVHKDVEKIMFQKTMFDIRYASSENHRKYLFGTSRKVSY